MARTTDVERDLKACAGKVNWASPKEIRYFVACLSPLAKAIVQQTLEEWGK